MSDPVEKLLSEALRVVTALGAAAETTQGLEADGRKLVERIARVEGFVDVSDIARGLLRPVAELQRSLIELERTGWIETRRERLALQVSLSTLGRERWNAACAGERTLYAWLGSGLDEHTVRAALATLRAVRRRLERDYAQMPISPEEFSTTARSGLRRTRCA